MSDLRASIAKAATAGDGSALVEFVATEGAAAVRLDNEPNELTALHLAAAAGQLDAVHYLLSPAVEAEARTARINNFTPLHAAAMHGHTAVCEALLLAYFCGLVQRPFKAAESSAATVEVTSQS